MNLQKEKWKERLPLLLSFLLPLGIAIIVCIDHGVYPFGTQCILHVDMYHQYCPFFVEMMEKIKEGGSFLYSWQIGLGSDFVSLYAYYLASPLNWLLLLCPKGFVIEFMTILVLLKIAGAGFSFGYYLKEHFGVNDIRLSVFAVAYALSAFVAAYSWNIMWMDSVALAPLILVGLERLVKKGDGILYTVTLALSILCNYYISIMICLFLVLYYIVLFFEEKEHRIKGMFRFMGYSLLAGGMGAVLILPEAVILSYSGESGSSFPDAIEWYFNVIAELARSCFLTESYTGRDHWPNLYCGAFVLLFVVLYFCNRKISWKKKIPRILLLILFVVSFANNILDYIWHGFHFPNSLPGRQSFLFILLVLTMCYEALLNWENARKIDVGIALITAAVFLLTARMFTAEEQVDGTSFVVTLILVGAYALLLFISRLSKEKMKNYLICLMCTAMVVELAVNFDVTGLETTSRTSYLASMEDYESVLEEAEEREEELAFYRTEELERRTKNDAAFYQYASATQFSSLMNINVSHFYQNLGMEGGKNFYCINGATPLISTMLSLKYVIADNGMEGGPLRTLVAESGTTFLYENKYVLSFGYMMSEEVIENWDYEQTDEIAVQNELARLLGAEEDMLIRLPLYLSEAKEGVTTITIEQDGYYYATYTNHNTDNLEEETSDGREKSFTKCSHGYTLDLGYCKEGTTVTISNTAGEVIPMQLYLLHEESVEAAYNTLNQQTMNLTDFSDTKVEGNIKVEEEGRLIFSIPKEDGWTLYIDGVETEAEAFADTFISVHLTEGEHNVKLVYKTPGLLEGAGISIVCLLIFLLVIISKKKKEKKYGL
ncbi:MAG: YfhO family protein [Roseburia sp.]